MRHALFFLALAQTGCSALGLGSFTIPPCDEHTDCDPLNEQMGIEADACFRYICVGEPRTCRLTVLDLDDDGHPARECRDDPHCDEDCDDCDDGWAAAYPGSSEVCDGIDNDCNLLVDDVGAVDAAPSQTLVSGTGAVDWHAYGGALSSSGNEAIAFGGEDAFFNVAGRDTTSAQPIEFASANLFERTSNDLSTGSCPRGGMRESTPYPTGGSPSSPANGTCTLHSECDDGSYCNGFELCVHDHPDADPITGCRAAIGADPDVCGEMELCLEATDECELLVLSGCGFASLAAAETSEGRWLGVGVEQSGCGGTVRAGWFTETAGDGMFDPGRNLLQRGDLPRSSSFRGIDLDDSAGHCTGGSRPDPEPAGAHSPAIAALAPDEAAGRLRPQALAAWIGAPNAGPGAVEVIGLWQEQFGSGPIEWVNATGDGIPERFLSPAIGDVAPVVAAWNGAATAGYLIAYGASDGVVLHYVPAFDDPPLVQPLAPFQTVIDPLATDPRDTPPIAEIGTEFLFEGLGAARSVDLAIGPVDGDAATVGVAWTGDDGVRVMFVSFDASSGTFDVFPDMESVAAESAGQVSIAYASDGLVLEGFAGTSGMADASTLGGWLVAWTAGGGAFGARYATLDGSRLEPSTMRLGPELDRLDIFVARVTDAAGVVRSIPRVAYHDAMEFRALDAFCGPPPAP